MYIFGLYLDMSIFGLYLDMSICGLNLISHETMGIMGTYKIEIWSSLGGNIVCVTRDQKVPGSPPVRIASCGHIPVVPNWFYQRLGGEQNCTFISSRLFQTRPN